MKVFVYFWKQKTAYFSITFILLKRFFYEFKTIAGANSPEKKKNVYSWNPKTRVHVGRKNCSFLIKMIICLIHRIVYTLYFISKEKKINNEWNKKVWASGDTETFYDICTMYVSYRHIHFDYALFLIWIPLLIIICWMF